VQIKFWEQKNSKTEIVADHLQNGQNFRNESLRQQVSSKDLSSRLKSQPIPDIGAAIGLNEKFSFIRELFNNDPDKFTETINILNRASNFNEAHIAIFLMYGIGDPQKHQYTYSLPLWGQTGVSSSSTYGTVNTYGSTATYSGTTTYTPTYGVVGSTMHTGTRVTYFRYFILDALDLNEYRRTKKEVQLWKTTVTSTGSSGDLRQVLPVMIGASKEYLGTNTGKKVKVILHENDKRVLEVKGIEKN